jgi:hypothetical protein
MTVMSVITVMISDKAAYLSHFLNDDERDAAMTVPEHPSVHRHVQNLIGMEKSDAYDDDDAHDDELQRFSKGGVDLFCRREIV